MPPISVRHALRILRFPQVRARSSGRSGIYPDVLRIAALDVRDRRIDPDVPTGSYGYVTRKCAASSKAIIARAKLSATPTFVQYPGGTTVAVSALATWRN